MSAERADVGATAEPHAAPRERRHAGVALVALWVALVVGLAESLYQGYLSVVKNIITHADPQQAWTAPASYLIFFTPLAIAIHLLARRRGADWEMRAAITGFAAMAIFGPIVRLGRLHPLAVALVSLGIALQIARLATRYRRVTAPFMRWTVVPLLAAVVALGAAVNLVPRWRERQALAALPGADAGAPNVLLIILDTVRSANMSLYGYARATTPNLASFASRGVVFEKAVSPAPWTLPAHASVFTGHWPRELSTGWRRPLNDRFPTLAEELAARGYRTAGFVANYEYTTRESGLGRGFSRWEDFRVTPYTIVTGGAFARWVFTRRGVKDALSLHDVVGRKLGVHVGNDLLGWLDAHEDGRPFFAFLNYYDAHNPYLPPAPYDTLFGRPTQARNFTLGQDSLLSPEQASTEQAVYDGAIAYLDSQLAALFDSLARRRVLDNTIVVVTADHGEEFAEHGLLGHGNSLYFPSLHVPLLVVAPGRAPAGVRIAQPVSTRDIAATVLELAGAARPERRVAGTSLARYWSAANGSGCCADTLFASVRYAPRSPTWAPISRGDMSSVVLDGHHLIRDGARREELYDVMGDPLASRDQRGDPAQGVVASRLSAALESAIPPH